MAGVIDQAFARSRTIILLLLFILIVGAFSYQAIPKEAEPDIAVPFIYVSMSHEGISPEDAERLLVRPMEKELQGIEGVKEMTSVAREGHASVQLEFTAGFDNRQALQDVREKVDLAKTELPEDTEEPEVHEINVALFPVLTVALSGQVPERTLVRLVRDLKDKVEALPGVLEVDVGGDREDLLEIVVEPSILESYAIDFETLFGLINNNNLLVAAGAMDTGAGRLVVKVPGVVEGIEDLLGMPVKVTDDSVVTVEDVADVRKTFKDAEGYARVGGKPAITLEVKKRVGANIIETIAAIRQLVEDERQHWPDVIEVAYMQDKSKQIRTMLGDLQNNVLSAIILVMIVILAAMGGRSSLLVGLAIPGSFLAAIIILDTLGLTLNIVVLFSLILVVGMLVDGAIVVSEQADRNLKGGMEAVAAYAGASKRMAWPVIASTLTTLAVFLPLLGWPGMVGEFMKFLPITVIIAMSASLAMALLFIPVLGSVLTGNSRKRSGFETGEVEGKFTDWYARLLARILAYPGKILLSALVVLVLSYLAFGAFSKGVEFFPDVEPEFALIHIHARGDLSIEEKDAVVRRVEKRIMALPELKSVYARSFNQAAGRNVAEDVIGTIQLEFIDWDKRRKAAVIMEEMRRMTSDIPGIIIEVRKQERGPSGGKPIQLEFSSREPARIPGAVAQVRSLMAKIGGFVDVEDNLPLPGIEWELNIDRERAAQFGANVANVGKTVQLVTGGIKVTDYRPDDNDEEVDIRIRYPRAYRNLEQLRQLRVPTNAGMVPIGNFVTLTPEPKTGTLNRVDARRVITLQADVAEGLLTDNQLTALQKALLDAEIDPLVDIKYKGEDEDQREAATFLQNAFAGAIFLMALILVTQFNSLYQSLLVLSAIVFSTAGVLLGLLITGQAFGIVMVGLGIIALAGIVVNNNIVLIDTYNQLRGEGMAIVEAAVQTGRQRLRPVLLTAITTVLGLIPMVLAMNIDLLNRDISFGAPSTQWWTQLASAIAGGLSFATLLTLVLTPCLLVMGDNFFRKFSKSDSK
ncbi:efflux RND transporter permease subunit [Methylomarinum vadi]|uniref:efflux RND transporter permease subunit n=1 Tax=Methylomarinum vadi TaxID=438855 RepID=UPI0006904AA7|nr:efflux RND transporter permease subunit [Methylomarinum vadi]